MIQKGSYLMILNGSTGNLRLITIEQIRAARGLLGWSQTELASRAGLSLPTVKRLEAGFGPRVSDEARAKLQRALEAAGNDFIEDNVGGAGGSVTKETTFLLEKGYYLASTDQLRFLLVPIPNIRCLLPRS